MSRKNFIRLGVGAAGASIFAACGGSSGNGESGAGGTPDGKANRGANGGGNGAQPSEQAVASTSDVPPGEALQFKDSGGPAVLVHLRSGDFAAYSAVCTHQQCAVAYQEQSGKLVCPCHGSVFDPANGAEVVSGPAVRPLQKIPVKVRDGKVFKS